MRIRITKRGIYGAEGEIPVGAEFDVAFEPRGLAGRYEIVSDEAQVAITNPAKGALRHPLDHDGDGKPGGSSAGEGDEINRLRADYQEIIGKRPFPGWDAGELQRRIDARLAE